MIQGNTENIFTAKPIEELLVAQKRILECAAARKVTIAVIGSGPSGRRAGWASMIRTTRSITTDGSQQRPDPFSG
jgi:NADH dehydrogenase FAD-containing subunit